jgi:hypothetical protein
MLDLGIKLLQIAGVVATRPVYYYPIEHQREFGPAMPVRRQFGAGRKLEETQITLRAGRQAQTMLPNARPKALPGNGIERETVLEGNRRWQLVVRGAANMETARGWSHLPRPTRSCDPVTEHGG